MQPKIRKTDRRVMYTKMFLRESLLELMKEKPIGKITADINRNTFYAHYRNPQALLSEIEDRLLAEYKTTIGDALGLDDMSKLIGGMCEAIARNHDFCLSVFFQHGDKDFLARTIALVHDRVMEKWRAEGVESSSLERLYEFITCGSASIIQRWLEGGLRETPGEIAAFIATASDGCLSAFRPSRAECAALSG